MLKDLVHSGVVILQVKQVCGNRSYKKTFGDLIAENVIPQLVSSFSKKFQYFRHMSCLTEA